VFSVCPSEVERHKGRLVKNFFIAFSLLMMGKSQKKTNIDVLNDFNPIMVNIEASNVINSTFLKLNNGSKLVNI
jgi:hypothetical protein